MHNIEESNRRNPTAGNGLQGKWACSRNGCRNYESACVFEVHDDFRSGTAKAICYSSLCKLVLDYSIEFEQ
jgi:hypothetical protein